jgi:plasmid maintenance system killer protein
VVTNAQDLSEAEMQALAAEFNYSETTFVLPPDDARHTARVRIFNRTHEMPFAGHPNVGTGYVLAREGRDRDGVLLFEQLAGLVEVTVDRDSGGVVTAATIAAPQPLSLGPELSPPDVAACVGLDAADVRVETHRPVAASVGLTFVLVEVASGALSRAAPNAGEFRRVVDRSPELGGHLTRHKHVEVGRLVPVSQGAVARHLAHWERTYASLGRSFLWGVRRRLTHVKECFTVRPGRQGAAMIKSFRSNALERFWWKGEVKHIPAEHRGRLRRILGDLEAAQSPADMDQPSYRLHPLTGDQAGRWSVRVGRNWRVTFGWSKEGPAAVDVDYEDYH